MWNTTLPGRNPWSIFDELEALQADMSRAFGGGKPRRVRRGRNTYPPLNVWSSEQGLVIDAELPGVNPESVDVSVRGDELTLKAGLGEEAGDATYYRRERPAGEFSRVLQLPYRADADGVKAAYRNGILRISVPRAEEDKPRKVAVEAA